MLISIQHPWGLRSEFDAKFGIWRICWNLREKLRVVQDIFVSSCLLKRQNDGFGEKRKPGWIYWSRCQSSKHKVGLSELTESDTYMTHIDLTNFFWNLVELQFILVLVQAHCNFKLKKLVKTQCSTQFCWNEHFKF